MRYEHSMGQFGLPSNILRQSTSQSLTQAHSTNVRNRWIPLAER
jgi:hypothetical protein